MKTLLVFFCLISTASFAQNSYEMVILKQANLMAAGLINGDYNTVATYSHPNIVKMMGGAEKMAAMVKQNSGQVKFADITFGKPSAVVTSGNELQCVVPQRVTMQLPQGTVKGSSSLIAFSFDGGKRWVFADTNPGVEKMRQVIPNISRKLVIPKKQQPSLIR